MASSFKRVVTNPRLLAALFMGFSSGLPLMLTGGTLQAWLKDSAIDISVIGRFSLAGLPYALKFLWAPFLDSFAPPFFGRRRGWGVLTQIGLMLALVFLAYSNPALSLSRFAIAAGLVAFFSASQDVVLDALRTEMLPADQLALGGSVYLVGYRVAMLVAGGAALALSATFPWQQVYLGMAALMLIGVVTLLVTSEPQASKTLAKTQRLSLRDRVVDPFLDFFKLKSAMEILLFTMLYKLPTLMATALTTVFLLEIGFDKPAIAYITKGVGLAATLIGTLAGGALIVKIGLRASLWVFGFLQALGGGLFVLLAVMGKNSFLMAAVIAADNFLMGLGTAAIVGFMMSVCSKKFTGTQYALLSSLTAFTRVILIAPAGSIQKALGWPMFYVFSILLALPGLLLLTRFPKWSASETSSAKSLHPADMVTIALFLGSLVVISTDFVWPMLGLPDVALWVGGGGLLLALLTWGFRQSAFRVSR